MQTVFSPLLHNIAGNLGHHACHFLIS